MAQKMRIAKLYKTEGEKREAGSAARRGLKSKIGFGGETVDAPTLTEEVVVPRSAALGRRHGSHLRAQLVSLSAMAALFDPATVLRNT